MKKISKPKINDSSLEEHLLSRIYLIRGYKVMLDSDLAELYNKRPKANRF